MNPFAWVRRKVAEAFVQGLADGAAAVTPEGEDPPTDLGELRALLAASVTRALPPAREPDEGDAAPAKRKK